MDSERNILTKNKFIDKNNNLQLEKFDPIAWRKIENSEKYKKAVKKLEDKALEYFNKNEFGIFWIMRKK